MAQEKRKKIDVAIADTKLIIKKVQEDIMLLNRELQTLKKTLDMLEILESKSDYE